MTLFADKLHDTFGTWPLGYIPAGGADYGEVRAVATAIGDGDDGRYHAAWVAAATRLHDEAETALVRGHVGSARDLLLRASVFYGASLHPLYGAPVDPRLLAAARQQRTAFARALALGRHPIAPLRIPFEAFELPACFIPARGHETETRPLIILTNGYDATIPDLYFAAAVAASRRGYHSLLFDGPGQTCSRPAPARSSTRCAARKRCCASPQPKARASTARCRTARWSIAARWTGWMSSSA
ncbi:MAG: hypothetical protein J0H67_21370 [Rhodospirillales bacterium]|nr:hypothetical protein [Rhodospirillales bacterium]